MKSAEFLERWREAGPAERANKDLFLTELCRVLGVEEPRPKTNDPEKDRYVFEKEVSRPHEEGVSIGRIDLYRAGAFVLEAKQIDSAKRDSPAWQQAMNDALGQALGYARSLREPPPFVVVCDIGYCFDLHASFDGSGSYRPFPDGFRKRLKLADLETHRETLRQLWLDPLALDPSREQAKVTREVAADLAALARELEAAKHDPQVVAEFLMRCLFTMFAEDVGLLPQKLFSKFLHEYWLPNPAMFPGGVGSLWRDMNEGRETPAGKLLRFNGGLFSDSRALPLTRKQLELLAAAAGRNWAAVDPSIFGTLLERALSVEERHRLGAHYTPRAYVERLVKPTIEEPLRADWDLVRAEVRQLVEGAQLDAARASAARAEAEKIFPKKLDAGSMTAAEAERAKDTAGKFKAQEAEAERAEAGKLESAQQRVLEFHRSLCRIRVLDPACGTGNFLYVTLDLFKRLESEVLALLQGLGYGSLALEMEKFSVTPEQFRGIEVKPWAKEIAELVLWIGYLQWQVKQSGEATTVPEPVLRDYDNIECRDAVLAWDGDPELARDAHGKPITRWDGVTMKKSSVTGEDVPDETATIPVYTYKNPRPAEWPKADFIIGNPPFIANRNFRQLLGDGYVDALKLAYPEIRTAADFVMYFWLKAAQQVATNGSRRSGLISTSRLRLQQNSAVVEMALGLGVVILFAIPDHPWPGETSDAKVRVAMSVVERAENRSQRVRLLLAPDHDRVRRGGGAEEPLADRDLTTILVSHILSDLSSGSDVAALLDLAANSRICHAGMKPYASSLLVSEEKARALLPRADEMKRFAPAYRNGADVAQRPRGVHVLDFTGLSEREVRELAPAAYQYLIENAKPERSQERNLRLRTEWWLFEASRLELRAALKGLPRYIVTIENSPSRYFVFLEAGALPDQKLRVIASADAFFLGVLSGRGHALFSLRLGGRHGVANTPVYNTRCFEQYPFPVCASDIAERIRDLGEQLDGHRKRQQGLHPGLTITGMYNVLEKLRSGEALTVKEQVIHEQGLVSVLKQIHDELDAAVFAAYGWPATLTDEEILEKLVALNHERAEEEKRGIVRWLRPEFQNPQGAKSASQQQLPGTEGKTAEKKGAKSGKSDVGEKAAKAEKRSWPKELPQQVAAVRDLLAESGRVDLAGARAAFKSAKDEPLAAALDSLAALGLAVASGAGAGRSWSAVK